MKRLSDSEGSDEDKPTLSKVARVENPTDFLTQVGTVDLILIDFKTNYFSYKIA